MNYTQFGNTGKSVSRLGFGFEKVGVHKDYFNINDNFNDEILMDLYL
jgi:hypothetical protein